ncbi:hypothetical protein [Actinomadura sp. WMMA1423]|uniref:hypothetical protein n=1 Tax=Actinomadura sp. WMMA1423 TaxID=2591108 RepID=UPI001146F801|nr:hypothetical protein [Actinomadura sp. WMMA1423]
MGNGADDNARAKAKRWVDLYDEMMALYGVIRTVLARLPLPVGLAAWDHRWKNEVLFHALTAFNRVRVELLDAQPIEQRHKDLLHQAVLDWLAAWDFAAVTLETGDPLGWQFDVFEHLIRRAEQAVEQVAHELELGED